MKKRPNILFLMTDEHRPDGAGFLGNDVLRTPVLDKIAKRGVTFTNAYTPSAACVPGRQCLAAGQLPRTCNCEFYGDDLERGYLTWSKLFSEYAYMTTACGKLHHMATDPLQGWLRRVGMDHMLSPIRASKHIPGFKQEELDKYISDQNLEGPWSPVKEIKRAGIGEGEFTNVWDDYTTQGAINIIREYFINSGYDKQESHLPHIVYVGFNSPHYPYLAEKNKFEYYLNRVPLFDNETPFHHPVLGGCSRDGKPVFVGKDKDVSVRELKRATAAYYANIESCDERFGRILDELEKAGEDLDEWIIVFTADHGEMLGEHAIWEKARFFESSVKVPLMISFPKRFNTKRIVDQNVNLCDIFATLCDLCDIPIPEGLDSRSLVPLMEGNCEEWNNESVSQFNDNHLMIKQDNLKYQYYGEDIPEVLFDLEKNPEETINFINDKSYNSALSAFRERLAELGHGPDADKNYINANY